MLKKTFAVSLSVVGSVALASIASAQQTITFAVNGGHGRGNDSAAKLQSHRR